MEEKRSILLLKKPRGGDDLFFCRKIPAFGFEKWFINKICCEIAVSYRFCFLMPLLFVSLRCLSTWGGFHSILAVLTLRLLFFFWIYATFVRFLGSSLVALVAGILVCVCVCLANEMTFRSVSLFSALTNFLFRLSCCGLLPLPLSVWFDVSFVSYRTPFRLLSFRAMSRVPNPLKLLDWKCASVDSTLSSGAWGLVVSLIAVSRVTNPLKLLF